MRRCQKTAAEAQEAVQQGLIDLREHNERKVFIILGLAIAVLVIVVVVAVKLG